MVTVAVQRPRVERVPPAPESLGEQAIGFARRVGLTLDPEQELVLAGRWVFVRMAGGRPVVG